MMEKISVVMATYNGSQYISEQLYSIINQSIKPDEIIICDDNSIDTTIDIILEFFEKNPMKYRLLLNKENKGVNFSFERALLEANGDLIFFSDQDDFWGIDKVKSFLNEYRKKPNKGVFFSNAHITTKNLEIIGNTWNYLNFDIKKDDFKTKIVKGNFVQGASTMITKKFVFNVTPFNKNFLYDYWIAFLAVITDNLEPIDEKLLFYRQHSENLIGMSEKKQVSSKKVTGINSFKNVVMSRCIQIKKFKSLDTQINLKRINNIENINIKKELLFWKMISAQNSLGLFKNIKIVIKYYLDGTYNKHNMRFPSFVRDLLLIFKFKIFKINYLCDS